MNDQVMWMRAGNQSLMVEGAMNPLKDDIVLS